MAKSDALFVSAPMQVMTMSCTIYARDELLWSGDATTAREIETYTNNVPCKRNALN